MLILIFTLSNSILTRRSVDSRRILRCIGANVRRKGSRHRVTARLTHEKIARRRTGHMGGLCRRRGKSTSGSTGTAVRGQGHLHRGAGARRSVCMARGFAFSRHPITNKIMKGGLSSDISTGHCCRKVNVNSVRRVRGSGICKQSVFRAEGLAFRPDIGLTAPPGCHLKPNSRMVVSV